MNTHLTSLMLICLLLIGCGQTGPLYLPEPETAPEPETELQPEPAFEQEVDD